MPGETLADQLLHTEDGGAYRRFDEVGVGGFGTVYFGRDQATNRPVAIKCLHPHLASDQKGVQRFEREARLARSLTHPNVVRVLDQGRDAMGVPFLVLEWVDGWTLAHQLERRGHLPVDEAVEIACQALAGLGAAHNEGITHRDIKPANLMVTPEGKLKVMDFGIARESDSTTTGSVGTLPYMAPEQFSDDHVDGRTDLYALGATLFESLAGRRPFLGPTATAYLRQHVQEKPPALGTLRPDLPVELSDAVMRALEKEPADRFQTAEAMRSALLPFAARQLTTTLPVLSPSVPPTLVDPLPPPAADPPGPIGAASAPAVAAGREPAPDLAAPAEPNSVGAQPPAALPPLAPRPAPSGGPPRAFVVGVSILGLIVIGVVILARLDGDPSTTTAPTPAASTRVQPTVRAPTPVPTIVPPTLPPTPPPTAAPISGRIVQPTAVPTRGASSQGPSVPARNYANELTDWGVPPQRVLQSQVGSKTPLTIPGGTVITTSQLASAIRVTNDFLLIDALKDDHAETIVGAVRLPNAGSFGTFSDSTQQLVARRLSTLTDGDLDYDLVFFCQGAECWESYNAGLRAINLGYTNVFWYRGGLASWQEAGLPTEP